MHDFLANLWFLILAFELAMYAILDGMDLGIGAWTLFDKDVNHTSTELAIIGPFWDANETWLVMAGGILFGAFPIVYGIGANALYVPIMILIFSLIFRAVAIEFREHSHNKRAWDVVFGLGSVGAIFGQGLAVGGLFGGIKIGANGFAGGPWDFLSPFSIILSFGFLFGYMMMGASYSAMKTEGKIQSKNFSRTVVSAVLAVVLTVFALLTLHFLHLPEMKNWLSAPDEYILTALYILAGIFVVMIISSAMKRKEKASYRWTLLLVTDVFVAGVAEAFPYIVPPNITAAAVASPDETLISMLIGIGLMIPVILAYNFYIKKYFKGKVTKEEGYGKY